MGRLFLRCRRAVACWRSGRVGPGVKPFGTLPGEAATIERMRALARKPKGGRRLSYAKIAKKLQDEGFPTRKGGPWCGSSVLAILKTAKTG
jgi:hypothetical protein